MTRDLTASEDLARLFEFSPSRVFLVDCEGILRYANRSLSSTTGLPFERIVGESIECFGHDQESPLLDSMRTKQPWQGNLAIDVSGHSYAGPASITPIIDASGACVYALCTSTIAREPSVKPMTPGSPLVLVVDLDGTILFIDRTVPGISREDAIGSSIYKFMPAEHHERIRRYLTEVVKTRGSLSYQVPSVGPYGTVLTYETHVGPIERGGEVVALSFVSWEAAAVSGDVEDRYRMLALAGMEGLIIHDGKLVVDANELVCDMFGYVSGELVGKPVAKLFAGRGKSTLSSAPFYQTGSLRALRGVHRDGSQFDVEVCGKTLPHATGLSTVIAIRDRGGRPDSQTPASRSQQGKKGGLSRQMGPVELSGRETDVLELLAQGMTNRQVAERLHVSARTVDHHVSHLLAKLGASTRTAAAMAARSKGLLKRKK